MTGWTTLTTDDVLAQFNDREQSAYESAKGEASGQSLADIVGKVVSQVRKAYADAARIVDAQAGTIPDGEKNRAVAIARWLFLNALPSGKSLLSDERKKAHDDAEAYFLAIAKNEIKPVGGVAVARRSRRRFTRKTMEGL